MPALPTLTVTDAQAQRMLAAWGSSDAYTAWLKDEIINFVLNKEALERYKAWSQQEQVKRDADRTALGG